MLATLAISANQIYGGLATTVFLLVCVLLILTILIQKPQGGGLSGAFGSSAGSGQTAFGAKTGDALTVLTITVFVAYIGLAIGLNFLQRPVKIDPNAPLIQAVPGTDTGGNSGTPMPATGDTSTGSPFPAVNTPAAPAVTPATPPAAPESGTPIAPAPALTPAPAPVPAPAPAPAPEQ